MKVVLVMFKNGQRREFPLSQEHNTLGRRDDCTLRIPARDVSRQHCEIVIEGRRVTVRDLGSSNGTYVNGKRIAQTELRPGDQLKLGPVQFVVQIDGKPADPRPSAQAPAKPKASGASGAAAGAAAPAPRKPADEGEEIFELGEDDFDLDDAITALDEDEEDDLP